MPIPAIVLIVSDALTATGAVVNCYALHMCGRSLPDATSILSRVNMNLPDYARRQDVGVCGVPQYNFDTCQNDLKGVMVQTSLPAAGGMLAPSPLHSSLFTISLTADNNLLTINRPQRLDLTISQLLAWTLLPCSPAPVVPTPLP